MLKISSLVPRNMLKKKLSQAVSPGDLIGESTINNQAPGESSKYFSQDTSHNFGNQLLELQDKFNTRLNEVNFVKPPIEYMYNPTEYARIPYELYCTKYCQSKKKLLFVGMNPGPFGMCQTGVPFGDTNWVKNWLKIEGPVSKPPGECPKRPVEGFGCTRKEQSGDRFWGFWSELCGTPDVLFRDSFVYNYCPLAFMDKFGRNLTPADIKDCRQLESICDEFFLDVINIIQPDILVAIGRYIEGRTKTIFKNEMMSIPIHCMPHPSPRAPNNNNWSDKAKSFIEKHQLMPFFQ